MRKIISDGVKASYLAEREPLNKMLQCFSAGNWDCGVYRNAQYTLAKQRQETDMMLEQLLEAVAEADKAEAEQRRADQESPQEPLL